MHLFTLPQHSVIIRIFREAHFKRNGPNNAQTIVLCIETNPLFVADERNHIAFDALFNGDRECFCFTEVLF